MFLSAMIRQRHRLKSFATTTCLLAAIGSVPVEAQPAGQGAQRAIFNSRAEAEAAAKAFNCQGAHRMGNQWMPCASHGETSGSPSHPAGTH